MRDQLSNRFMAYLVALSSAVGLGNLWKFPTETGLNGGSAFVITYVLSTLIVGIPLLICEFAIGRKTKTNILDVFTKLKVHKAWGFLSWLAVISSFMIFTFYVVIVGWVYTYLFKAIKGDFASPTPENLTSQFSEITSGYVSGIATLVVLTIVFLLLYKGISNGIEKAVKILTPLFLLLIIIVFLNSLRLDGFGEAMNFLYAFKLSNITPSVIMSALGLAFFKLSIASGTMLTYGSYFTNETNLPKTAATVAFADVGVSLLAGMALFPVVFTFGLEPTAGPGLLFNTVPLAFSNLPAGNLLTIAFFGLAAIVGTMAATSLINVTYAVVSEKFKQSRKVKTIGLYLFIAGVIALTMFPFSPLGNVEIGGMVLFDGFNIITSNYLLPIGGLVMSIFVGWFLDHDFIKSELGNSQIITIWKFTLKFIVPVIILLVFLNGLGLLPSF